MVTTSGGPRSLGVPARGARLRFDAQGQESGGQGQESGGGPGRRRLLLVDGRPAFELSFFCGTCPLLFRRLEGAREKLSLDSVRERLTGPLNDPDDGHVIEVMEAFGALLPQGPYLPLLLTVEPRLIFPGRNGDYFSGEQVATWGTDPFWGLPQYPHTPYYRTFETAVDAGAHLYEFVVPMVPPTWNERERVAQYVTLMERGTLPTAVAASTLDVCEPATGETADPYGHWGLTHFLLDGHHKLEAAAQSGRPVRLLSLLTLTESLATAQQAARLPGLRARPRAPRAAAAGS
ncbi:hypothetical protein ACTWJ8_40820 (plasmid) [Streptomyces sp. SDT5-1]|uniref:hypothetical protein n=1 Tax=Streptomyces sp. SDT5-1 TaxID=3406418 RepID=UPI003FD0C75A